MLSTGVIRADPHVIGKRFGLALFSGFVAATLMLLAIYGVRTDMPVPLLSPRFWLKVAFPLAVVGTALMLVTRLSRPGASLRGAWVAIALPFFAVMVVSVFLISAAPPGLRLELMLGGSWRVCTLNIALLSAPTLAAAFWAMRGLAPTRLGVAGAGAGLLAGAQAVLVYTLYCVEMAVPFWGVWYVFGMSIPTVIGAVLGPRLLRW